MKLGVCYYPEHWPEDMWAEDAARMADIGLSKVRIGEFAWSRIEPALGIFDWGWLDRAIETLAGHGLEIVLGTPTATPPKWLVDRQPDMLALDQHRNPRRFGSRRHYCFSSLSYRRECARIVTAVAERYGEHDAVTAWQTDNEYGCHDTVVSYSAHAAAAFRRWLEHRYGDVGRLNEAWGTVFWSQEYRSFDEIDPPAGTVTEANPAHRLDYRRFSSDQVVSFNQIQVEILRRLSPGRDVLHNYMGFYAGFDHHAVSDDLDIAGWDSYPLGFLDQGWDDTATKQRYLRQGHPDFAGFHHDLYRGCGRLWVMEQQPGPVNWAPNNPAPLDGMVRAWTWEAFAHGAELVSYFRWRQAPFAQEQMHAGLNRPDGTEDQAAAEVRQVARQVAMLGDISGVEPAPVALVFSYEADWVIGIQPQGNGFAHFQLVFEWYSALRRLGLDIDIVSPKADLSPYRLVVVPCLPILDDQFVTRVSQLDVPVVFGPRCGSKTVEYQIPEGLPPGPLQRLMPMRVLRVESLRTGTSENVLLDGNLYQATVWREHIESDLPVLATFDDGRPALVSAANLHYVGCWPDADLLQAMFMKLCTEAGLTTVELPVDIRLRRRGDLTFAFNYGPAEVDLPADKGREFVLGGQTLPAAGVAAWRTGG